MSGGLMRKGFRSPAVPYMKWPSALTSQNGLTSKRSTGLDAGARLGLTLQARGSAQVDIGATFFAENLGSGRNGQTTDGIGTVLTAAFFPEAY